MVLDWRVNLSLYIIIEDVFMHIIQDSIFNLQLGHDV